MRQVLLRLLPGLNSARTDRRMALSQLGITQPIDCRINTRPMQKQRRGGLAKPHPLFLAMTRSRRHSSRRLQTKSGSELHGDLTRQSIPSTMGKARDRFSLSVQLHPTLKRSPRDRFRLCRRFNRIHGGKLERTLSESRTAPSIQLMVASQFSNRPLHLLTYHRHLRQATKAM